MFPRLWRQQPIIVRHETQSNHGELILLTFNIRACNESFERQLSFYPFGKSTSQAHNRVFHAEVNLNWKSKGGYKNILLLCYLRSQVLRTEQKEVAIWDTKSDKTSENDCGIPASRQTQ